MSTTLDIYVAAAADEATDWGSTHPGDDIEHNPATTYDLGFYAPYPTALWRMIGIRLQLNVPNAATINEAKLRFKSIRNDTSALTLQIAAEDVDDAAAGVRPSDAYAVKTTAVQDWTPVSWVSGNEYDTVDFASVLQEIVNRGGWVSGNYIRIIIYRKSAVAPASTEIRAAATTSTGGGNAYTSRLRVNYDVAAAAIPAADFVGNPVSGSSPLSVAFTDLSTESPVSWLWTFGDGTTSVEQNPAHIYAAPGTYTVSLEATNGFGADTETKVAYVTVTAPEIGITLGNLLGGYRLPINAPGGRVLSLHPRIIPVQTQGGVVVHAAPGHPGDEVFAIPLDFLPADPQTTLVASHTGAGDSIAALGVGGSDAIALPIRPTNFAAITTAAVQLRRSIDAAGYLSVEVWSMSASDLPVTKVGLLSLIQASSIATSWNFHTVWNDRYAWPCLMPGGFIVLNAASLTAGSIEVGGDTAVMDAGHVLWDGSDWTIMAETCYCVAYQGGDLQVIRGLQDAYCYPSGDGPQLYVLTLDDSSRYEVKIVSLDAQWRQRPLSADHLGRYIDGALLNLQIIDEVGQQGLT